MVEVTRDGRRIVYLLRPVTVLGVPVEKVELGPVKLDHLLRWNEGRFDGALALMAELTELTVAALRELTFPDADIVMAEFLNHVPPAIRANIESSQVPHYVEPEARELGPDDEPTEEPGPGIGFEDR